MFIASGIGGFSTIEREHIELLNGGPRRISPFFIPASIINLAAGQVSIRFGARGPNLATCTACTASAHAIGEAFEIIKRGDADVMIAGGSEAAITPMGVGGFAAMRALSTRNDEPARASRPFDKDRDGFVIGEGAGMLILEELEVAQAARRDDLRRDRRLRPVGATRIHLTGQPEDGNGAVRSMRMALRKAGIAARPGRLHQRARHVDADQRPDRDARREDARSASTRTSSSMSSTKSMTGHLLGAAGGLEAGITALAVQHQVAPPTINLDEPDPALRPRLRART